MYVHLSGPRALHSLPRSTAPTPSLGCMKELSRRNESMEVRAVAEICSVYVCVCWFVRLFDFLGMEKRVQQHLLLSLTYKYVLLHTYGYLASSYSSTSR